MEGDGVDDFAHQTSIAWSIVNEAIITTGNVREYLGVYESDELGQLIVSEVAAASNKAFIASVDYSLESYSHYPQFPGRAEITIEIPHTLGGSDVINF